MLFAEFNANEFGLLLVSLIGCGLSFWALHRTENHVSTSQFPLLTNSSEAEQNRQLQGLNKHLGELRGELKQLKRQVDINEESDENLRDRFDKFEETMTQFTFKQVQKYQDLHDALKQEMPESEEDEEEEDEEEEDEDEEDEE